MTTDGDEILREEPTRFLSGSFSGAQVRWSTIEKEAYAIYWAPGNLDDLLRGIAFIIRIDYRNLPYMNKHGYRKVNANWTYSTITQSSNILGALNIQADVLSRLVKKKEATLHHILVLKCSAAQRELIEEF